jgi:hypothetical protein
MDIVSDNNYPWEKSSPFPPSAGSGGGVFNVTTEDKGSVIAVGGRGGGQIVISASLGVVNLTESAVLLAEGGKSSEYANLGAGSGGGVLLTAVTVNIKGFISVKGGDALGSGATGGAGGGGRISVIVSHFFLLGIRFLAVF